VNLFVAGYSASPIDVQPPRRALAELIAELPFFDPAAIEVWRASSGSAVMAAVAHPASVTGGVRYTAFEADRAALFAGRPVRWSDDGHADGRGPLDPACYHAPAERWAPELDGRCTVVRADDVSLELFSDPLGAYPVFELGLGEGRWFSNSAEALRLLSGDRRVDEEALASVLASGWSLGGHPVWRAVRRVPRGVLLRLGDGRGAPRRELLPVSAIASLSGRGLDAGAAAATLGELTAALADWPGRPSVVPVTGGRDSRVVLAAALRAGVPFEARTGGDPASPDVIVGAQLCAVAGLPHGLLAPDPHGDRFSDLARAARLTALASGGTATLADGDGFPLGARPGPLPLWHSGQGGEIARVYYGPGRGQIADSLYGHFAGRRPGRTEIVSAEAADALRRRIGGFVDEVQAAGTAPVDVPDLFYLLERMACWAAPSHGVVELVRDTTSPLWSARLLPHLLGLPSQERALDGFHLRVLRELAPELVDLPFQDGSGWPKRRSELGRRIDRGRTLARKGRAELRRRAAGAAARRAPAARRTPEGPRGRDGARDPADPFDAILAAVREAAHSQAQHPAWNVLDRKRVTRLLASPAVELDAMNRMYVWRLASAFLGLA
jgi:hypothetical protein